MRITPFRRPATCLPGDSPFTSRYARIGSMILLLRFLFCVEVYHKFSNPNRNISVTSCMPSAKLLIHFPDLYTQNCFNVCYWNKSNNTRLFSTVEWSGPARRISSHSVFHSLQFFGNTTLTEQAHTCSCPATTTLLLTSNKVLYLLSCHLRFNFYDLQNIGTY